MTCFKFMCCHYLFPPSIYLKSLFHSFFFSTIRSFADRDLRFALNSSSVAKIGFLVISLNGASWSFGRIGKFLGTSLGVLHFLNACLHILSSNECNVITSSVTPIL